MTDMNGGYIKLWRKSLDSAVWQCPDLWRTWTCCLMLANHKDGYVKIDGLAMPVIVKPGQFITGRFSFHQAMYPKKKKENKSPSTVWRWLQTLEKLENMHIQTNSRFSIVTVVNWDIYQQQDFKVEQANEQPVNSRRTAGEQPVNTNKNVKNDKNTNMGGRFDEFWSLYPKKIGKAAALKSWKANKCDAIADRIMAAIPKQTSSPQWQKNNGQYIPHPTSWLNQGRWDDVVEEVNEWI